MLKLIDCHDLIAAARAVIAPPDRPKYRPSALDVLFSHDLPQLTQRADSLARFRIPASCSSTHPLPVEAAMSFHLIGLGKLLNAMYATDPQRTTLLRTDIRNGIKKASGSSTEKGGDFYGPFWADAKRHVAGELDLRVVTPQRAEGNKTRERLYPLLCDGFLLWWEEKRRLRNVPFTVINNSVKARYEAPGLGTVKVENTLSFTVGEDGHRILYPYFCEDPSLSDEAARLGLWVMSQCIKGYALKDLRLLDVLEGRSFSVLDTPLIGNEEALFLNKYALVLDEWQKLRAKYP